MIFKHVPQQVNQYLWTTAHLHVIIYIHCFRCPLCFDNEVAIWVNRKCLCRQKFDCGLPPVCVDGRKGPGCLQPDCGLCKGKQGQKLLNCRWFRCSISRREVNMMVVSMVVWIQRKADSYSRTGRCKRTSQKSNAK